MNKMKIKNIVLLSCFLLLVNISYSKSLDLEDIKKSVDQINKNLPKTYNNVITRQKVEFDYKNKYLINRYILLNVSSIKKYQNKSYAQNIMNNNKQYVCETGSSSAKLNQMGVGFKYFYYDKNKNEIFKFMIEANKC